jgi:hypothetical protein
MLIQPHITPKLIDEFDILFESGLPMPITIDREAGDTIDMSDPNIAIFTKAAKPSLSNPDVMIPAEEITVFMRHVLTVTHRAREVYPPTPEEKDAFRSLHRMPDLVQ